MIQPNSEASQLLSWPDGVGWLVLSGGNSPAAIIRASALARCGPGPIAYLAIGGDLQPAQAALDDLEALGAASGYLVDPDREEDEDIAELLGDASLIVLADGPATEALLRQLMGPLGGALAAAHEAGAFVLAEGQSAAAFGSFVEIEGELLPGLGWLDGALISVGNEVSGHTSATDICLHIGRESALALGPAAILELWGEGDARITFSSEFLT